MASVTLNSAYSIKYALLPILLLASVVVRAEPTYLKCDLLSRPNYQQFSSEKQKDEFFKNMYLSGRAVYVLPPPEVWIVDLENDQVRSPEIGEDTGVSDWHIVRNLEVTEGMIVGKTRLGSVFELNRISLKLSYTKFLAEKGVSVQGIDLPIFSTWTFQCAASKAPAV